MKRKLLERQRHAIVAKTLGFPLPLVRQVAYALKAAGRIPASRPIAAAWTPESLTRLIFGLCADIATKAAETEQSLSAMARRSEGGAPTAGEELENLIAQAAELIPSSVDWWAAGDLFFELGGPALIVVFFDEDGREHSHRFGKVDRDRDHATRYLRIPLRTLSLLAAELLEETE